MKVYFFVTITIGLYIREIFKLYDEENAIFMFFLDCDEHENKAKHVDQSAKYKTWFRCSIYLLHALSSTANLLLPQHFEITFL